jgi:Tol biopolymer transport system component
MNADGTNEQNLTNAPTSNEARAAFTADGTRIGFDTDRDGNLEVYLMNADGTNPVNLTNYPAAVDGEPDFRP